MILFGCLCLCLVLVWLAVGRPAGTALASARLRLFGAPVRVPTRRGRLAPIRRVASPSLGAVPPPRIVSRSGP